MGCIVIHIEEGAIEWGDLLNLASDLCGHDQQATWNAGDRDTVKGRVKSANSDDIDKERASNVMLKGYSSTGRKRVGSSGALDNSLVSEKSFLETVPGKVSSTLKPLQEQTIFSCSAYLGLLQLCRRACSGDGDSPPDIDKASPKASDGMPKCPLAPPFHGHLNKYSRISHCACFHLQCIHIFPRKKASQCPRSEWRAMPPLPDSLPRKRVNPERGRQKQIHLTLRT